MRKTHKTGKDRSHDVMDMKRSFHAHNRVHSERKERKGEKYRISHPCCVLGNLCAELFMAFTCTLIFLKPEK